MRQIQRSSGAIASLKHRHILDVARIVVDNVIDCVVERVDKGKFSFEILMNAVLTQY